jgi:hypothetical protein
MRTEQLRLTVGVFPYGVGSELAVEHILKLEPGVVTVSAEPCTHTVTVEYAPALTDAERLIGAVVCHGFQVERAPESG